MGDVRADVCICHSVEEIDKYLTDKIAEYNSDDVLCVFDVDDTLITLDHSLVQYLDKYGAVYKKLLKKYHRVTDMDLRRCLPTYVKSTELGTSEWLKSLPYKKIALTASPTGKCADGTLMTEYRYQELKERGITFETTFDTQFIELKALTCKGQHPTYHKGILFSLQKLTGETSKGTVLCTFLKKIGYTPKCVVLIDDRQINLDTVQTELETHHPNTKFIGILYTGTKKDEPSDVVTEDDFRKGAEELFKKCYRKFNIPEPE